MFLLRSTVARLVGNGSRLTIIRFASTEKTTPTMTHYLNLKKEHPEYILLFRMGDFYEMFFDDAVRGSQAVDIALTKRGKHNGQPIPMAGIPHHSLDTYLSRFVKKGLRVAVCEQVTEPVPNKPGETRLVRREIKRLITPGTLVEDNFLQPRQHNYLMSLYLEPGSARVALAWTDLSTADELPAELARVDPAEILVSETETSLLSNLAGNAPYSVTTRPAKEYATAQARASLEETWGTRVEELLDSLTDDEAVSVGSLLNYVNFTQKGARAILQLPRRFQSHAILTIDPASRRSLEITRTMTGEKKGSLLWVIDKTLTSAGGRLLSSRLSAPVTSVEEINSRLDAVEFFVQEKPATEDVRSTLKRCHDIERALQRLSFNRAGPRDLLHIALTLKEATALSTILRKQKLPASLQEIVAALDTDTTVADEIIRAIVPEPPFSLGEDNFIQKGFSEKLDELLVLRDNSQRLLASLQQKYRDATGVPTLKIRENSIIGYFVEVPQSQAAKVPLAKFTPCQTVSGACRFKSEELTELEKRIRDAGADVRLLELVMFNEMSQKLVSRAQVNHQVSQALAALDVASSLAVIARERQYSRPVVSDSDRFHVRGGRHPNVEVLQMASGQSFVTNDCNLSLEQRLWLVTGPNMGGKSTFLRQNALISILAQMGSFVPADRAELGIVDQLFCRVGASDDLGNHLSTFMVEMVETAAILKRASARSMVIMDEIGRGTATTDGLAIAWAVMEYLHNHIKCRVLFATHFHELGNLRGTLPHMHCATMDVVEQDRSLVFTHRIVPGVAAQSYGVPCARLAGVPEQVTERAAQLLTAIQARSSATTQHSTSLPDANRGLTGAQVRNGSAIPAPVAAAVEKPVHEGRFLAARESDVDNMRLADWKAVLREYQALARAAAPFVRLKELE